MGRLWSFLWSAVRALLFFIPPEKAHDLTLALIRFCNQRAPKTLIWMSGFNDDKTCKVWGLDFKSPIGLAAGFDKNGQILEALPSLGFGFAEIGTVTPRPQPGNPLPRLARDPKNQALFNRMGFNNWGAEAVAARIGEARPKLPTDFRVGINVGKNKDTDLRDAYKDYVSAAKPFRGLVDYVVINVSSPNTPGLRGLQAPENIRPILESVHNELATWSTQPPLLLKLAPELDPSQLQELAEIGQAGGLQGWILTNTLQGTHTFREGSAPQTGGWSGSPLTVASRTSLQVIKEVSNLPVISVGGILNQEEAQLRLAMGASLIQVYTGWIFNGPRFPNSLKSGL